MYLQTTRDCLEFNTIMIKPKSKHTIRHILELPSSSPPSKRPAAKPPDAPWMKRRKLILPPVNKQVSANYIIFFYLKFVWKVPGQKKIVNKVGEILLIKPVLKKPQIF